MIENYSRPTAYEYTTFLINRNSEPMYIDHYRSFGWELVETDDTAPDPNKIYLKMKRDRRLKQRGEIGALQRQCDSALKNIEKLESQKTSHAFIASLSIGLVGLAFVAAAIVSGISGLMFLTVLFGVLATAISGAGYLTFAHLQKKKTAELEPLIDQQYDIVADACEKGYSLLIA